MNEFYVDCGSDDVVTTLKQFLAMNGEQLMQLPLQTKLTTIPAMLLIGNEDLIYFAPRKMVTQLISRGVKPLFDAR